MHTATVPPRFALFVKKNRQVFEFETSHLNFISTEVPATQSLVYVAHCEHTSQQRALSVYARFQRFQPCVRVYAVRNYQLILSLDGKN